MIKPEEIITLDFETYFDRAYTLRKLSTSEYIRDDRFKAQCVGIKMGTDDVVWIPDVHVEEALHSIDWASYALLAHHTQFDGFILGDRYGLHPAYYLCTLSMGRGLHSIGVGASLDALARYYGLGHKLPDILSKTMGVRNLPPEVMQELGLYCMIDDQLCHDLFMQMIDKFTQSELDLIDETCRMFCEPVLMVDIPRAQRALKLEKDTKAQKIAAADRDPANLSSNPKFADVLRSLGVEPPMKISPTTGEPTYAFAKSDAGLQELMVHDDETVRAVVAARLAVKSTLNETRAQRLLDEGAGGRTIPVYLKYYGAHTGRWSGGNKMNLQNLPRGGELRRSVTAPPGFVLGVADSAQIEARMLAWVAKEIGVLEQFRNGEDVYKHMAAQIYGIHVDDVTPIQRFVGKVAVLGLGYGMGWRKFLMTITLGLMGPKMDLSPDEAQVVVNGYRQARHKTVAYWRTCDDMLHHMLYDMDADFDILTLDGSANKLYLPNNMYLEYPGLCQSNDGFVYFDYENADIMARGGRPNPKRGRKIYGGLLCLAAGTDVLTDEGWVPIEEVTTQHKVFDGVEFVNHGGLLFKGHKKCITLDGVTLTPDHEVFTDVGWQEASQLQRPDGPKLRYVDRDPSFSHKWQEMVVGVPLPVRQHNRKKRQRGSQSSTQRPDTELRLHNETTSTPPQNARYDQTPGLRCLAQYVRQVQAAFAPSMETLRSARHNCLRGMASSVREFLERHGGYVPSRANAGSHQQRWAVPSGQLPVGGSTNTGSKPSRSSSGKFSRGRETDRSQKRNLALPVTPQPVYDIANAGPRQRFVVRGNEGPFLAHNCENIVQALARIIVGEQLLEIAKRYKVATTTHDEVVAVIPEDEAEAGLEFMLEVMRKPPVWAPDLPLNASGGFAREYSK